MMTAPTPVVYSLEHKGKAFALAVGVFSSLERAKHAAATGMTGVVGEWVGPDDGFWFALDDGIGVWEIRAHVLDGLLSDRGNGAIAAELTHAPDQARAQERPVQLGEGESLDRADAVGRARHPGRPVVGAGRGHEPSDLKLAGDLHGQHATSIAARSAHRTREAHA